MAHRIERRLQSWETAGGGLLALRNREDGLSLGYGRSERREEHAEAITARTGTRRRERSRDILTS